MKLGALREHEASSSCKGKVQVALKHHSLQQQSTPKIFEKQMI